MPERLLAKATDTHGPDVHIQNRMLLCRSVLLVMFWW